MELAYLRCKPNVHFLQLAGAHMGGCELWNHLQLRLFSRLVQVFVVLKVYAVRARLKSDARKKKKKIHFQRTKISVSRSLIILNS